MRLVCATKDHPFADDSNELDIVLYGNADIQTRGSAGAAVMDEVRRRKLDPIQRAWDFLSLALAVTAADLAGSRGESPDGWTRQFELKVSVADPDFWNGQQKLISKLLGFLTTDIWQLTFDEGGLSPKPDKNRILPMEDSVMLLSGGLDSFVGGLDLVARSIRPFAVSQTVRGDADNQRLFAQIMNGGLNHLQLNHNTHVPNPENPPSQRARSLLFISFGVLAATSLRKYHEGEEVPLYICENGFISINPPLTGSRLGSLSTRTTHPVFFGMIQQLFLAANIRIRLINPYQLKTKGEMLRECSNQTLLVEHAYRTTSCGRFKKYGYKHCGRCVPCLVRRAAFLAASIDDATSYVYLDLGRDDEGYAGFDDVRSIAMALAEVKDIGLENWVGTALSTALLGNVASLQDTIARGLEELGVLLSAHGVR